MSSKSYLPNVIVSLFPALSFTTSPTGIHTNWLPAVALWLTSSTTIPFVTFSVGFITLNPAGTTTWFPKLSFTVVFFVSLPVTVPNVPWPVGFWSELPADVTFPFASTVKLFPSTVAVTGNVSPSTVPP